MNPTAAIMLKLFRDTAVTVLEIALGVLLALLIVRGTDSGVLGDVDALRALVTIALAGILVIAFLRWLPIKS